MTSHPNAWIGKLRQDYCAVVETVVMAVQRHPWQIGIISLTWYAPALLYDILVNRSSQAWLFAFLATTTFGAVWVKAVYTVGRHLRNVDIADPAPAYRLYINGEGKALWTAKQVGELWLTVWLNPVLHAAQFASALLGLLNAMVRSLLRLGGLVGVVALFCLALHPETLGQLVALSARTEPGAQSTYLLNTALLCLLVDLASQVFLGRLDLFGLLTARFDGAQAGLVREAFGLSAAAVVEITSLRDAMDPRHALVGARVVPLSVRGVGRDDVGA